MNFESGVLRRRRLAARPMRTRLYTPSGDTERLFASLQREYVDAAAANRGTCAEDEAGILAQS
jgi:hypothetical protein